MIEHTTSRENVHLSHILYSRVTLDSLRIASLSSVFSPRLSTSATLKIARVREPAGQQRRGYRHRPPLHPGLAR